MRVFIYSSKNVKDCLGLEFLIVKVMESM